MALTESNMGNGLLPVDLLTIMRETLLIPIMWIIREMTFWLVVAYL